MKKKIQVVFISSVFDEAREGPAVYARYLWDYFSCHTEIDFHLVVSASRITNSKIHCAGVGNNSLETYKNLQCKGMEVARKLGGAIVHGNSAHTMWKFSEYNDPLFVQVNDYDSAQVFQNTTKYISAKLYRRYGSLIWRHLKERQAVLKADLTICNSEYTSQVMRNSYRCSLEKLKVIYKSVDIKSFSRPSILPDDPYSCREKGQRLIFVGTNWRRKGLEVLMKAFKDVLKRFPAASLEVVGSKPSDLSESLHQYMCDNQLGGSIYFSGVVSRDALPAHFWHSDLSVLPSREEALGVSILESLAAGVPCIATRVGGIPEILDGYNCGSLVERDNYKQLGNKIVELLSDDNLRQDMRCNALERVQKFSKNEMLKEIEALYFSYGMKMG